MDDFHAEGYILDIGGGGEGIIGRMKGNQVIAIDLSKRELEGAPTGPLKIVMDATDTKFLDDSFPTVTSFFTLMYIKAVDQEKVFKEVYRVLVTGGHFLIWDVVLPQRFDKVKDVAAFRFRFRLPGAEVEAGYGTFFPDKTHDLAHFVQLAERAGFQIAARREEGRTFFLELRQP